MDNYDRVFVGKLRELQRRTVAVYQGAPVEDLGWELMMAASLLRDLLMGTPHPLVHTVNRDRRLKLRFEIARTPVLANPELIFASAMDTFWPPWADPQDMLLSLTLDQFLGEIIMVVERQTITIRDLIDYIANAAGAVHFGDPTRNQRPILAAAVGAQLRFGDWDHSVRILQPISWVVLQTLAPLANLIQEEDRPDPPVLSFTFVPEEPPT